MLAENNVAAVHGNRPTYGKNLGNSERKKLKYNDLSLALRSGNLSEDFYYYLRSMVMLPLVPDRWQDRLLVRLQWVVEVGALWLGIFLKMIHLLLISKDDMSFHRMSDDLLGPLNREIERASRYHTNA